MAKEKSESKKEPTYTKQQLINSKHFHGQEAIIRSLLKDDADDQTYTVKEAKDKVQKWLKKEAK